MQPDTVAAGALARHERAVRLIEKPRSVGILGPAADGDADRNGDSHRFAPVGRQYRAAADVAAHGLGHVVGPGGFAGRYDGQELFPADAGQQIVGPERVSKPCRDSCKNMIADPVAEGVVHRFEPVYVDQHDREWQAADRCLAGDTFQLLQREATVVKPCQRIQICKPQIFCDRLAAAVFLLLAFGALAQAQRDFFRRCICVDQIARADVQRQHRLGAVGRWRGDQQRRIAGAGAGAQFGHKPETIGNTGRGRQNKDCVRLMHSLKPAKRSIRTVNGQDTLEMGPEA